MSDIAVVIVNYTSAGLAIEAVESVLAADAGGRTVEVHVVDNASPGDDAARLTEAAQSWGPRVTLHLEPVNHGFGRGNNLVLHALALRPAPPELVFLLNPDARLKNDALGILADFLDARPDVGLAGCRIEKPGEGPVTAAFRFPTMIGEFASSLAFGPVSSLFNRWRTPLPAETPTGPVDWVAGAAAMARLRALNEVGFFDPDYFLYYEEVDLMRRLHRAGWSIWHVAESVVVHVEGAATGVRSGQPIRRRHPAYVYESWRLYFTKNHGRGYALTCALICLAAAAANVAISRVRRRTRTAPPGYFADVVRHVLRPLLIAASVRRHG